MNYDSAPDIDVLAVILSDGLGNQDVTARLVGNAVRHGTQDASRSPHSLAPHNDEIGFNLISESNDYLGGVADGRMDFDVDAFDPFRHILEHALCSLSHVRLARVIHGVDASGGDGDRRRQTHARHQVQPAATFLGEFYGQSYG
jgi:hypothetical protein